MLKIILCVGVPGSGKSTWAKAEIAKDPLGWVRINNDQIREMVNGSIFSQSYEKLVSETRYFMVKESLRRDKSVIIDNVNLNKRHFTDACNLARQSGKDVQVFEKLFYVEIEEAIERDSKREGKAKVGEEVIRRFWKMSGGKQFRFSNPRVETLVATKPSNKNIEPMVQDPALPRAVIFDNDGTISLIHAGRSPYDASTCDQDLPHPHVIECMRLYYKAGYKILFVSGREDKDRAPTERFYRQYFPEIDYELFMRPTGDMRKDVLIKEEIFNNHIKNKYFVAGWFDDRLQVSQWVYLSGLPLFRVNNPEAVF